MVEWKHVRDICNREDGEKPPQRLFLNGLAPCC